MTTAAEAIFQRSISFEFHSFAGSTDLNIISSMLERYGMAEAQIPGITERLLAEYVIHLRTYMNEPNAVRVLPGVRALLADLSKREDVALALVTGNMDRGARIKLSPANLNAYFPVGAFGSDAADRNLLPPIAVERAQKYYGTMFAPEDTWIIGDTPNDIECALTNDLHCLALATTGWTAAELSAYAPDVVLDDLADVARVRRILLG